MNEQETKVGNAEFNKISVLWTPPLILLRDFIKGTVSKELVEEEAYADFAIWESVVPALDDEAISTFIEKYVFETGDASEEQESSATYALKNIFEGLAGQGGLVNPTIRTLSPELPGFKRSIEFIDGLLAKGKNLPEYNGTVDDRVDMSRNLVHLCQAFAIVADQPIKATHFLAMPGDIVLIKPEDAEPMLVSGRTTFAYGPVRDFVLAHELK